MLILTRKLGESITIGDDIKVSVLGVHGRQVRLGIDAPQSIVVHREEIYVKVQEENRKASKSLKSDLMGMVKLLKGRRGKDEEKPGKSRINYKDDEPGKNPSQGKNRPGNSHSR